MRTDKEGRRQEEEYFARIEFERRQQQVADKQKQMQQDEKQRLKDLHWMRCPKCGMEMIEIDFEGIKVDKCSTCLGLYFDDGEVAHLVNKNKPGFLGRLSSLFQD